MLTRRRTVCLHGPVIRRRGGAGLRSGLETKMRRVTRRAICPGRKCLAVRQRVSRSDNAFARAAGRSRDAVSWSGRPQISDRLKIVWQSLLLDIRQELRSLEFDDREKPMNLADETRHRSIISKKTLLPANCVAGRSLWEAHPTRSTTCLRTQVRVIRSCSISEADLMTPRYHRRFHQWCCYCSP